jgi:hypothetical protein
MPSSAVVSEWLRFEWSVRALAQPAPIQLALFPGFVVVADELAGDFDAAFARCRRRGSSAAFPEKQRAQSPSWTISSRG